MSLETQTVGIFHVERLGKFRWRATNSLTQAMHVTYGVEVEVVEQLEIQSRAWELRFAREKGEKATPGAAWRDRKNQDFAVGRISRKNVTA
jgi:hypothetical protein